MHIICYRLRPAVHINSNLISSCRRRRRVFAEVQEKKLTDFFLFFSTSFCHRGLVLKLTGKSIRTAGYFKTEAYMLALVDNYLQSKWLCITCGMGKKSCMHTFYVYVFSERIYMIKSSKKKKKNGIRCVSYFIVPTWQFNLILSL